MVSVRRNIFALPTLLVAGSLLAGCGFVHRHFQHKDADYKKSAQERPLEVPPDLDTPNSSGALVVPAAGAAATGTPPAATAAGTAATQPSAVPPSAAPAAAGVQIGGDGLRVGDSAESTWTRVGLALERSGAANIVERDEAGGTYSVETTGQTTQKAGWFKRAITLGHADRKVAAKVRLTVRVSADGAGSKVAVEGATDEASQDAARALLATLHDRLS
jgi:uncharacterized lipoprotein